MEFILNLTDNNLPSQVLCVIVLLIIVLKDIKLHQNFKVGVLYLASFIMILMGWIEVYLGVIVLVLAEFALLEIFTDDIEKRSLFNVIYKTIDCAYRLFVEYYFALYLGAILIMGSGELVIRNWDHLIVQGSFLDNQQSMFAACVVLLSSALILAAILCITRMKFETKTVTNIIGTLNTVNIYSVPVENMRTKFDMLATFEDKTFFDRDQSSHTVLSPLIMKGAFKYIDKNTFKKPFQTLRKIFSRGYGTIEMQLVRNIGVERGYDTCVLRRKTFEIVYSNLIFNSYRKQFARGSDSVRNYKYWILWCYLQKVPVKFYRRFFPTEQSTAQQIFHKDFEELSLEEFFVWCISLEFFALIGPKTVMKRESIIINYELNRSQIDTAIEMAYKAR